MFISDNASTDMTQNIAENAQNGDSRITYIRQESNIGPYENFKFVLSKADTDFFMWAACDDLWHTDFVKTCLGSLAADPSIGLAFTGIANIDEYDMVIREYPDLPSLSGRASAFTLNKFISSPEAMGKANMIYGIYRTDECRYAMSKGLDFSSWGSDMSFVLACLAHNGASIAERVLFYKRIVRGVPKERAGMRIVMPSALPQLTCPDNKFPEYLVNAFRAVKGTKYEEFILRRMTERFVKIHFQPQV